MKISTEQDIIALIQLGEERPDLDYKEDINLTASKKEKAEIAKDIIAMANSGGGLIIGGVKETPEGYVWKGMSQNTLKAFDSTALNDFVKNYCSPSINTTTRKMDIDNKIYGVVIVPEFVNQPHIVVRDYPDVLKRGDILVRSASNNSVRAGPDELRKLIDLSVRRRQGVLKDMLQVVLENSRPILIGGTSSVIESVEAPFDRSKYAENYKGFRIVTIAPVNEQISVRPMILRSVAESALIRGRQGYPDFPSILFNLDRGKRFPTGIAFEQGIEDWPTLSFAFFGINGQVFCADSLWEDRRIPPQDAGYIGLFSTITMMFEATLFARQYYPALNYEGMIQVHYSQESSVPRVLQRDSNDHWPFHTQYYNDMAIPVTVERTFGTDADLKTLEEIVKDMMTEFFWYFYLDLDSETTTNYLEYVKKKVTIPGDLLSSPHKREPS